MWLSQSVLALKCLCKINKGLAKYFSLNGGVFAAKCSREKKAFYAIGISDAKLNMIFFFETSVRINVFTFKEYSLYRVIRLQRCFYS
jgi:hypothetical protein